MSVPALIALAVLFSVRLAIAEGPQYPVTVTVSGCVTSGAAVIKGNGSGGCANATADTDYAAAPAVATPTYGTTVTPNLATGAVQFVTVTDGTGWTLANATNAVAGKVWYVDIYNNSGGAGGTISLGTHYLSDGTLAAPANGKRKRCTVTNETASVFLLGNCTADM